MLLKHIDQHQLLFVLALYPLFAFPSFWTIPLLLTVLAIPISRFLSGNSLIISTPVNVVLLLFALIVSASVFVTFDLEFSLSKLTGTFYCIIVFYAVVSTSERSEKWLILCFGLFVLMVGGLIFLGLLGSDLPRLFGRSSLTQPLARLLPPRLLSLEAIPNTGVNFNQIAGLLCLFTPQLFVTIHLISQTQMRLWVRYTVWLSISTTLSMLCFILYLTRSRSAFIGVVVSLLFVVVLIPPKKRWMKILCFLVMTGAVAFIGTFVFSVESPDAASFAADNAVATLSARTEIWDRALTIIYDAPYTGLGMNVFRKAVDIAYPLAFLPIDWDAAHAHNMWLQTGVDLGLLGLVAYMALWLLILYIGFLQLTQLPKQFKLDLLVLNGSIASLVAFLFFGIADTIALGARPSFLVWFPKAFIIGIYLRTQREKQLHDGLYVRSIGSE